MQGIRISDWWLVGWGVEDGVERGDSICSRE